MSPEDALPTFLIALASGTVLGVAILLLIYKMIDGDLPVPHGLSALILIVMAMYLAIHPPHPVLPGVILVLALTLMAIFPYAEKVLEDFELRAIDSDRLARSYEAVRMRPDNFAAKLELAKQLHGLGFQAQAIQLASTTLNSLSNDRDEVRNRSMRDVFHREDLLLKRSQKTHHESSAVKCLACGAYNRPSDLFCTGCSRLYLLDAVKGQELKPRVWGKQILAWASIAVFIPLAVAIGMNTEGILRPVAFGGGLALIGGLLFWLFRPPKHSAHTVAEFLRDG